MGVYQSFVEVVEKYRDKTAMIFLGEKISYARLLQWVERFAGGLTSLGMEEGEKIILYLPNTPQWVIAWLAKIGRAHV